MVQKCLKSIAIYNLGLWIIEAAQYQCFKHAYTDKLCFNQMKKIRKWTLCKNTCQIDNFGWNQYFFWKNKKSAFWEYVFQKWADFKHIKAIFYQTQTMALFLKHPVLDVDRQAKKLWKTSVFLSIIFTINEISTQKYSLLIHFS